DDAVPRDREGYVAAERSHAREHALHGGDGRGVVDDLAVLDATWGQRLDAEAGDSQPRAGLSQLHEADRGGAEIEADAEPGHAFSACLAPATRRAGGPERRGHDGRASPEGCAVSGPEGRETCAPRGRGTA